MKIHYQCLSCIVNQAVRVAELTNADNREVLFKKVFAYLSEMDFSKTNPEITGATFRMLKEHIKNEDPYKETRKYYTELFLKMLDEFDSEVEGAEDSFGKAVKYAIIGNIIDFGPAHEITVDDVLKLFKDADNMALTVDHTEKLLKDISSAKSLLYLGDNCGEICLDKLLLKQIKRNNPNLKLYFGVRGEPVLNDSIEEDAYLVGIDKYADIISNGDDLPGTVISRTSDELRRIYDEADLIIAKGQANYECLSEYEDKNTYFLLMTKCGVIAGNIGVPQRSLVCMKGKDVK